MLTLLNLHFSALSAQAGHSGALETTQKAGNKSEQSDALCRDRGAPAQLLPACPYYQWGRPPASQLPAHLEQR